MRDANPLNPSAPTFKISAVTSSSELALNESGISTPFSSIESFAEASAISSKSLAFNSGDIDN